MTTRIGALSNNYQHSRYDLSNVQVVPADDGVFLYATNSVGAALVKAEGQASAVHLMPGTLTPNNQKDVSKGVTAELNGQWTTSNGKEAPAVTDARFPNHYGIPHPFTDWLCLRIDARLLAELATALNEWNDDTRSGHVTLLIDPQPSRDPDGDCVTKPVAVVGEKGIGVVMPCTTHRPTALERFNTLAAEFREKTVA